MNFYIVSVVLFAAIAAVQADVSHLTREYLPPVSSGSVLGNDPITYGFAAEASSSYAGSYQPEAQQVAAPEYQVAVEQQSVQSVEYAQPEQQAEVVPGGDASSYQPAQLIPEYLQPVVPGGDASSYQPAHLIPENQQPVVPGGDASSYQPANLIPENLQPVAPGGDASSYQPAYLIPENLQPVAAEEQPSFEYNNYVQSTNGIEDYQGASSASSSGIDTQYGSNGGYVY